MATDFEVFGPFKVPCQKQRKGSSRNISSEHTKEFWQMDEVMEVADKQGCYVFALRAGKGFRPWYIGKATKSMRKEVFDYHKLVHYNHVLFKGKKATPVLFIVAPGGRKKKASAKAIDEMETFLIQAALTKNPDIQNIQKTGLPTWTVKNVVRGGGKGGVKRNAIQFRKMIGL